MECHSLEMKGRIRSADGIYAIIIENDGRVRIYNSLKLNFGSPPPYHNYDKTLSADTSGGASWQWRSFVKDTIAIFAQASPPTGWAKYDYFTDNSMLLYQHCDDITLASDGTHNPISWTTSLVVEADDNSKHTHTYSGTTVGFEGQNNDESTVLDMNRSRENHQHTYSGTTVTGVTGYEGKHTHSMNQATYLPNYNTVIAGVKI